MRPVTAVLLAGGKKADQDRVYRGCIFIWEGMAGLRHGVKGCPGHGRNNPGTVFKGHDLVVAPPEKLHPAGM